MIGMESSSNRMDSDVTIVMRVTSGLQAQPLGVLTLVVIGVWRINRTSN